MSLLFVGDILATRWKDKRDVYTLSTIDNDVMIDTSNGRPARNAHETLKPQTVVSYNRHKAGVDKHDQMASYYPMSRKTLKWWKKLFFHFFQLGTIQAQKLYNLSNPRNKQLKLSTFIAVHAKKLPTVEPDPVPGQ